ncbi:GNAT family N-acetyltransferase [Nocardioides sp. Root151]|uniref:GNAT family N-acetyltransferase n=1 Tax=Nocardioides sp. Root151 TaxID=1736475 RepID=UPI000703A08F|nr:GNAT family N-acetyltransferase [Nocardioides sp. Root151]KQZ66348.1 hypothetical protein ASD66_22695 [Nocardioides sp. Root151]
MEVREAHAAELSRIGELTAAVYVDEGYIHATAEYVAELKDAQARATGAELLVAVDEGLLLGAVTYCPTGSKWRETAEDDEGEFRMLVVAPTARGRGVGRALVAACLDRARAGGLAGVRLSSLPTMKSAHRLYAALGFTRLPEADWSPVEGIDLLAFGLRFS